MKPRAPESQRDSALQPKVARHALPWVSRRDCHQPQRSCARPRNGICRNPVGVETQGSAALNPGLNDVAPLGQSGRCQVSGGAAGSPGVRLRRGFGAVAAVGAFPAPNRTDRRPRVFGVTGNSGAVSCP